MTDSKDVKTVLNIGSGNSAMQAPHYDRFYEMRLDVNDAYEPDIVADLLEIDEDWFASHPEYHHTFDAVHLSHVLEHFYSWDNDRIMKAIKGLLKEDGMVDIYVPDILAAARKTTRQMGAKGLDTVMYRIGENEEGAITFHDMLYGYPHTEDQWMGHKQGFDMRKLVMTIRPHFSHAYQINRSGVLELGIVAFVQKADWHDYLFTFNKGNDNG